MASDFNLAPYAQHSDGLQPGLSSIAATDEGGLRTLLGIGSEPNGWS